MAMTPNLWTINALATELNMDRRAVAKRLRNVRPFGKVRGHAAWRLQDALRAIEPERQGHTRPHDPTDFRGFPAIHQVENSVEAGAMIMALSLLYQLAPRVTWAAVRSGVEMDKAEETAKVASFYAMQLIGQIAEQVGWSWGPDTVDLDCMEPVAWREMAAKAGTPDWQPQQFSPLFPEYPAEAPQGH